MNQNSKSPCSPSRSPLLRSQSRSSVSKEPTLRNVVEEDDSVFTSGEENTNSYRPINNNEEYSGRSMDGYNRQSFSKLQIMRTKIKYHFMNPWQKYKARKRKPWKLVIQILKIIIVTLQVYLFGSDRFSVVTFIDDNREALRFMFLKDYSKYGQGITVYTKDQTYSYMHYAHEKYYHIQGAVGSYDYTNLTPDGSPPPVKFCYDHYKEAYIDASNNKYRFDPEVISKCFYLPRPRDNHHVITNGSFQFKSVLSLRLIFLLNAINLKGVKAWDKPSCYRLNVTILFDNKKRDGQMPVTLNLENTWLECKLSKSHIHLHSIEDSETIRILLMAFDSIVILICFVSLILSVRSVYKSLMLSREAREFFKNEEGEPLSWGDTSELFNFWFVLIILSDVLTILGSVYKMAIDQKDSNYYDVCSLFLGIAVLLVWTGLLRFLGYFKQYNTLLLTIKASGPSVLRFWVCTGLLFLGFTLCGWIVIGPYNPKFRDTTITAECLYSLVNGDDMFNTYALVNPKNNAVWIYSKLYLYIFISLFIYVVLSLFIGIIADTYERLKDMGELPPSRLHRFAAETTCCNIQRRSTDISEPAHPPGHSHIHRLISSDSAIRHMSLDSTGVE